MTHLPVPPHFGPQKPRGSPEIKTLDQGQPWFQKPPGEGTLPPACGTSLGGRIRWLWCLPTCPVRPRCPPGGSREHLREVTIALCLQHRPGNFQSANGSWLLRCAPSSSGCERAVTHKSLRVCRGCKSPPTLPSPLPHSGSCHPSPTLVPATQRPFPPSALASSKRVKPADSCKFKWRGVYFRADSGPHGSEVGGSSRKWGPEGKGSPPHPRSSLPSPGSSAASQDHVLALEAAGRREAAIRDQAKGPLTRSRAREQTDQVKGRLEGSLHSFSANTTVTI